MYTPGIYECEVCGAAADEGAGVGDDFPLPADWVEVVVRRPTRNQLFVEQTEAQEKLIAQQVSAIQEMVKAQGGAAPNSDDIEDLATLQVSLQYPVTAPEWDVAETEWHFCAKHAGTVAKHVKAAKEKAGGEG